MVYQKIELGYEDGLRRNQAWAFQYIRENGLCGDFLKSQGVKFTEDTAMSAWYDFIEKHSSELEAHLYIDFAKAHKKVITDKSKVITDKNI